MKTYKIYLSIAALLFSTLACSIFVGGPEYPTQTIPYSPNEVQNMRTQIEQAFVAGAETGIVTLQINENQLTSYMVENLQAQTNPPFTEPLVLLRNGQMQMYGKVTQSMFNANILLTMNVGIDELTGQPKIEIVSADFGPLPAPEGLNTAMNAIIAETFTGSLGPVAVGFRLEAITIADGIMTLTGRIK